MKYLIIYAHPNPVSFNHAIKTEIENALKKNTISYAIRDLYDTKFHPILSANDFGFFKAGKVPADIQKEQEFIKNAEHLIFIYPIWWFSMPAVLKGYIDRVFSHGFAYSVDEKGIHGLLTNKKATIINTTGGLEENYKSAGFANALTLTTDTGIFGLCGMKIALHKFLYAVPTTDNANRVKMLDEIKSIQW